MAGKGAHGSVFVNRRLSSALSPFTEKRWQDEGPVLTTSQDMCTDDALKGYAEIVKKNLGEDKVELKIYPNAVHGFTVRGDDMVESEKKQKEDAAKVGIDFVKRFI